MCGLQVSSIHNIPGATTDELQRTWQLKTAFLCLNVMDFAHVFAPTCKRLAALVAMSAVSIVK